MLKAGINELIKDKNGALRFSTSPRTADRDFWGKAQKDPHLLTPTEGAGQLPLVGGKNWKKVAAGWRWGVGACSAPPSVWGLS